MSVDLIMEDARWKTLDLMQIVNNAFNATLWQLNLKSENFICCVLACSNNKIKDLNIQFRLKCLVAPPIFSRIITFLPPLTPQKLKKLTKV